jgi:hypothetical protein
MATCLWDYGDSWNYSGATLLQSERLSDRYGLETAMQFLPLFAFLAGILYFAGAFFYVNDAARVEQVEIVMED